MVTWNSARFSVVRHLLRCRYFWFASALFIVLVGNALHQDWPSDFWDHAATIRALAEDPLEPMHPMYGVSAPSQFYSPYHLLLARVTRAFGIAPIDILALVGPINSIIVLLTLYVFVSLVTGDNRVAFYSLLFTLFLWGPGAWYHSGFLNATSLGGVQGYPSISATGFTLMSFVFAYKYLNTRKIRWFVPVPLFLCYVVLTHPFTAIAGYGGILAIAASDVTKRANRTYWIAVSSLVIPIIAWFAWPWFDAVHLLSGGGNAIHEANRRIYSYPYIRAFGVLLAVPVVFGAWRDRPRDPIALMFCVFLGTYLFGAITGIWSLGRIMPFLAIAAHIALARWAVEFEDRVRNGHINKLQTVYAAIIVVVMVVFSAQPAVALIRNALPSNTRTYERYEFIITHVGSDDAVIATLETGWRVPTFTGKIVAALHPMPFVETHEQRQRDTIVFFADTTTYETRERLLDAYQVKFILIDTTKRNEARLNLDNFTAFGPVVDQNGGLILIRCDER